MAVRAGGKSGRSIRIQSSNPYQKPSGGRGSRSTPAPASSEGTGRRVYIGNLSYDVSWQDLKDHCKSAGRVLHADILEESSGRSKGCGVVEFSTRREADIAIDTLTDTSLKGRKIFVREDREERKANDTTSTTTRVDRSQRRDNAATGASAGDEGCRLFVGNLSFDATWKDLKDHFRRAGHVTRADVLEGNDGRSKGCGIVEFSSVAEADIAIAELNDTILGGRQIVVRQDRGGSGGVGSNGRAAAAEYVGSIKTKRERGERERTSAAAPALRLGAALPSQRGSAADGRDAGRTIVVAGGGGGGGTHAAVAGSRSVYVGNLSYSVSWQDLKDYFKKAGHVVRADVMEEAGGRSKGCGIVEFSTVDEAQTAIDTLNDTELSGRLVFVREDREGNSGKTNTNMNTTGNNRNQHGGNNRDYDDSDDDDDDNDGARGGGGGGGGRRVVRGRGNGNGNGNPPLGSAISRRGDGGGSSSSAADVSVSGNKLYVGNLAWDVTWFQLKDHFKRAGEVVHADVVTGPDGRSKGFGIVEMATSDDANEAVTRLNNTRIGGREIYVREDREER